MSIAKRRYPRAVMFSARRASDLMVPNPLSLNRCATIQEAAAFFTDKRFSAAPVIDGAGRPVGVVSTLDVLRHLQMEDRHEPVRRLPVAAAIHSLVAQDCGAERHSPCLAG